jgi:hypothetical protein
LIDVGSRIEALDLALLSTIKAQLEPADRRSLLSLHAAWREIYGPFNYLEIGSHLGGSLQALICDPACRAIVSIDSRPPDQPDLRGFKWEYPGNTTARMLSELSRIPGADLSKLTTIDASTDALVPAEVRPSPQVCFIDGEHTDEAALRDARFCRTATGVEGCIVFHDAQVVYRGIRAFLDELQSTEVTHRSFYMPNNIFVVELGLSRLSDLKVFVDAVLGNAGGYLWSLHDHDRFREWYLRSTRARVHKLIARARKMRR